MKLADLKVGEEYAVGAERLLPTQSYGGILYIRWSRARYLGPSVCEKRFRADPDRTGANVQHLDEATGQSDGRRERVLPLQQVQMPWAEFAERQADAQRRDKEERKKTQELRVQAYKLREYLKQFLPSVRVGDHRIEIYRSDVERLLSLVGDMTLEDIDMMDDSEEEL